MSQKLRKVSYTYCISPEEYESTSTNDMEKEWNSTSEREGYFHKWVEKGEISPETGAAFNKTYALVEDAETGKMQYIEAGTLKFLDKLENEPSWN